MNFGDPVEVNEVWASQGALRPPLRAWFKGYTFERFDGDAVLVRKVGGAFDGLIVRYARADVRRM